MVVFTLAKLIYNYNLPTLLLLNEILINTVDIC